LILAIETSCDDTSVAWVSDGTLVGMCSSSQIREHARHGGVVPELASRLHVTHLPRLLTQLVRQTGRPLSDATLIAVTTHPGLEGCLLVGKVMAQTLGTLLGCPVMGVDHLMGHMYSAYFSHTPLVFPAVVLIISGGHTLIRLWRTHGDWQEMGGTRDDAAGEAFDKVGRLLGLPYPAGPAIERLAKQGIHRIPLPIPMADDPYDMSFSGLKSAVRRLIVPTMTEQERADMAMSFQDALIRSVSLKVGRALEHTQAASLVVVGGVAANQSLVGALSGFGVPVVVPPLTYCTDNAAMIGMAAYYSKGLG